MTYIHSEYMKKWRAKRKAAGLSTGGKPSKGWYAKYYNRPDIAPKRQARQEVLKAIRKGILKRLPCQECGVMPSHAHHPNYKKPLKVVWLCHSHHRKIHSQAEGK